MRKLIAALALLVLPAFAQQPPDAAENAKRTITAIEGLLKERPNDPTLYFYLARFQATALDVLQKLQGRRYP